jgi:hypothetical protein
MDLQSGQAIAIGLRLSIRAAERVAVAFVVAEACEVVINVGLTSDIGDLLRARKVSQAFRQGG